MTKDTFIGQDRANVAIEVDLFAMNGRYDPAECEPNERAHGGHYREVGIHQVGNLYSIQSFRPTQLFSEMKK